MSGAPARLHAAYRRSIYEAEGAMARIGRRSPSVDALLRQLGTHQGGFVTAWNPFSRRMPPGWNARMLARLRAAARRLRKAEGKGGDGRWQEDHLLLAGDPRRLVKLARRFRQAAIVAVRYRAPARLLWTASRPGQSHGSPACPLPPADAACAFLVVNCNNFAQHRCDIARPRHSP